MSKIKGLLQLNSSYEQSNVLSFSLCLTPGEVLVVTMVSAVIAFNGLLGNLVVMSSVLGDRKYTDNPTNLLLCSLAVADLLVCLIAAPVFICALYLPILRICGSIIASLGFASVGGIVSLTVNRFISIIWSLKYPRLVTSSRVKTVISLNWATSIGVFVNKMAGQEANQALQSQVGIFLLPLAMVTVLMCYVWIYKKSKEHQNAIKKQTHAITGQQAGREADFNSILSLFLVTGTFLIAWLPPALIFIIVDEDKNPRTFYRYGAFVIPLVLANSAFNPVIYYLRGGNFRTVLARFYRIHISSRRFHHEPRTCYFVGRRVNALNDFQLESSMNETPEIIIHRGRWCDLDNSGSSHITKANCDGLKESRNAPVHRPIQ